MADLRLGKFDVVDRLRRHFGDQRRNLISAQLETRRRPFVEAFRQFAHRLIAAFGDIGDDASDRAPDLRVGLFLLAGKRRSLHVRGHWFLLFNDLVCGGQQ